MRKVLVAGGLAFSCVVLIVWARGVPEFILSSQQRLVFSSPQNTAGAQQSQQSPRRFQLPKLPSLPASFLVRFGLRDNGESTWDGKVESTDRRIVSLRGWQFEEADTIDMASLSWRCKTRLAVFNSPGMFNAPPPLNLVPKGVIIAVESNARAPIRISTARGYFEFTPSDIQPGSSRTLLDGQVSVEAIEGGEKLGDDSSQDDYPAAAFDNRQRFWISWIAYRQSKDIVRARFQNVDGSWSQTFDVSEWGDHYQTSLAADAKGGVWIFWSGQKDGNWDIFARHWDGTRWSGIDRLTESPEPDLFPKAVSGRDGAVFLTWQGFRRGQSDILLRSLRDNAWSAEMRVSDSAGNDWQPSAAVGADGRLWIAWDSYSSGNYDVVLRSVQNGIADKIIPVADSALFEAHAAVAVDAQGNPWVAWDQGAANWGKDWARDDTFRGSLLYLWRHSAIARVGPDGVKATAAPLQHALPESLRRFQQVPQPVFDAEGRLWVFFRTRTAVLNNRYDGWANGGRWETFVTRYDGDRWLPATYINESVGGSEVPVSAAPAADGLRVVWSSDQRPFRLAGGFGARFTRNNNLFLAGIKAGGPAPQQVALKEPTRPGPLVASPVHPDEKQNLQQIRTYQVQMGGKTLRIFRGDLHRHTDISADGAGDGSLLDLYRYSLDAASLDYVLVSDHNMGGDDEYSWWRTQKSNDLFKIGSTFVPLYGYERSVSYPNGHRNVIFLERGVRTLPIKPEENQGRVNSGAILYPHLRQNQGITTSHSGATSQGSDWRDWDIELEPIVELYQGYHASYEYEGAPKAETSRFIQRVHGGYEPAGFWWNALNKGYKLGVQASSDHLATHTSYACIYAADLSRSALMDAMKARHTYAATDNIVVDFRTTGDDGEHIMGDVTAVSSKPRFTVKIYGTSKISELALIRSGKFLYTLQPGSQNVDLSLMDNQPLENQEAWYYVRVTQDDRQMAWSSPIWVTVKR
ncbi:MAG TPA: hypothetical protein VGK99_09030 [Acidobacteriota bacterium]|jgi:hypothetical protein